jgi:hypothetical protein
LQNDFYLYFVIGLVVLAAFAAWIMGRIRTVKAQEAAQRKRLKETGIPTLCQIMMANNSLHQAKPNDDDSSYAQVVFVRGYSGSAEKAKLAEIVSLLETHFPYHRPLLIPTPYSCSAEAYSVSVSVYWDKLPGRTLQQNHLMFYTLTGPEGGALMMSLEEQSKLANG